MAVINEIARLTGTWTSHVSWLLSPYRSATFVISVFIIIFITRYLFKNACRANVIDFFTIVWVLAIFFSVYDSLAWGNSINELFMERFLPLCTMAFSFSIANKTNINDKLRVMLIIVFGLSLAVYVYLFILTSVLPVYLIHDYGHEYRRASITRDFYWCLSGSVLSYLAARFRPCMLLLSVPFPGFYFAHLITDFYSPYGKTDVLVGTGRYYVYIVYLLFGVISASILAGIYQKIKRMKSSCSLTADK